MSEALKKANARVLDLEDDVRNLESIIEHLQEIIRIKDRLITKYRTVGTP